MGAILPSLAVLAVWFGVPGRSSAAIAIVPDDHPTVQLGIDSGADTIVVRAGTYPENALLTPPTRRVLMADSAAISRPTLQGLTLWASDSESEPMKVVGLRFTTKVMLLSGPPNARMEFEKCLFEAAIDFAGEYGAQTIRDCVIRGHTSMYVGALTMERDTIEAGGMSLAPTSSLAIRNCWFRGPGIGAAPYGGLAGLSARAMSPIYADIRSNVFENCQVGIALFEMGTMHVANNQFRNCGDWGMVFAEYSLLEVIGNDLRQCGIGIQAWGSEQVRVTGNTLVSMTGNGIDVLGDYRPVDVRDNTALRCLGDGIRITSPYPSESPQLSLTGNTSAMNGRSGYDLAYANSASPRSNLTVSSNIAYGNGDWGIRWSGSDTPTLSCNDWFANASGPVSGTSPGATDLYLDPLFCDIANDDVRLRSDSPLLGGACGQIGARGVGCDGSTAVLVALFAAEASDEGVRIRWRLGGDEEPLSVWIERSAGELGPWLRVATERTMDGAVATDWDRTAEPGRRHWYRLVWTTADGSTTYSSPIVIDLESPASSLTLRVIGPNPASGPVAIEYVLPHSAEIDLTVHDVLGREVARLASGVQSRGSHVTQWTGTVGNRRAPPGLYFVRLGSPDGQQSRRILLRQ